MNVINLTPHPVTIYGFDVPDRFEPGEHEPQTVLEPSGTVARIGEVDLGTQNLRNCPLPIELVEFGSLLGLPPQELLDAGTVATWYVVSLPLALAATKRADLLVPWREIRNTAGTVIGCRMLARPV